MPSIPSSVSCGVLCVSRWSVCGGGKKAAGNGDLAGTPKERRNPKHETFSVSLFSSLLDIHNLGTRFTQEKGGKKQRRGLPLARNPSTTPASPGQPGYPLAATHRHCNLLGTSAPLVGNTDTRLGHHRVLCTFTNTLQLGRWEKRGWLAVGGFEYVTSTIGPRSGLRGMRGMRPIRPAPRPEDAGEGKARRRGAERSRRAIPTTCN